MDTDRRRILALGASSALLALPALSRAQPLTKQARFIVAYAAGSATDTITRYVAQYVGMKSGQPAIVENRPGADGNIAAEAVARSSADGSYTMLVSGPSTHAANASIYKSLPFDPEKDFRPLTTLALAPYLLVVNAEKTEARTVPEFLSLARSKSLSFASASVGGRIAGEQFRKMGKFEAVNIPYKSSPRAMTDLLGGHFDYYFSDALTALPQVTSGKIVALAVTTPRRLPSLPDVPTLAESGFSNFDVASWIAAWSAESVPENISRQMAVWVNEALDNAQGRSFLTGKGLLPMPGSPEQLLALQRRDTKAWGKIIVEAGMQQY